MVSSLENPMVISDKELLGKKDFNVMILSDDKESSNGFQHRKKLFGPPMNNSILFPTLFLYKIYRVSFQDSCL